MRYWPKLTKPTSEKIAKWALSANIIRKLLDAIDELGENPGKHLKRVEGEENALMYAVSIPREGSPPMDHLFDFSVIYAADEETLSIFDCDHLVLPSEEE